MVNVGAGSWPHLQKTQIVFLFCQWKKTPVSECELKNHEHLSFSPFSADAHLLFTHLALIFCNYSAAANEFCESSITVYSTITHSIFFFSPPPECVNNTHTQRGSKSPLVMKDGKEVAKIQHWAFLPRPKQKHHWGTTWWMWWPTALWSQTLAIQEIILNNSMNNSQIFCTLADAVTIHNIHT